MFKTLRTSFPNLEITSIEERLDQYKIVIHSPSCAPSDALRHIDEIFIIADDISLRDRYELEIDFDGDVETFTDRGDLGKSETRSHVNEQSEPAPITYCITIRKPNCNHLSIYDLESFAYYLNSESLSTLFEALSSRFNKNLLFECRNLAGSGGSRTIQFLPWGEVPDNPDNDGFDREGILTAFKENSFNLGMDRIFLPHDFHICRATSVAEINAFMQRVCSVLCAIFLSSNSEILEEGRLRYKMLGYKTIEDDVCFGKLAPAHSCLFEIYSWAYGAGARADRIGLARNVLSLHVDHLEEVVDQPGLWNAIHSNYQIYLKENVSSYLEVKNKISEFLIESTAKAHDLVGQLVESLRSSVLLILTFLLSVVVVNGLKNNGLEVVFSSSYLFIVFGVWVVLSLWIGGAICGSLRRLDEASSAIETILKEAYGRIILEDEIDKSMRPIIKKNRAYLVCQCWRYGIYWSVLSGALLVIFSVGNRMYS